MKRKGWGFFVYNGMPECGKTFRAVDRAVARARETGAPILAICREAVDENFKRFPQAQSLAAACRAVWERGESTVIKAATPKEVNQLLGVAIDQGYCILIIDGIWDCLRAPAIQPNVNEVVRAGRHYLLDLHATSQSIGDFAKMAKSCAIEFHQGRETDLDDLRQLEKRFGWKPEIVTTLPPRVFLEWSRYDAWQKKISTDVKKAPETPPAGGVRKSSK